MCTVAVADAIVHQSDDYGSYIHRWCRSHPCPMGGYGGRFAQWVRSNCPQPYGSFGNGSAMRVSAIGWAFDEMDDVLREAEKSAACSHDHPEGIRGAQAVALAIRDARHWKKAFSGAITPQVLRQQVLHRAIRLYHKVPDSFQLSLDDYRNRFDETCQGTVPVAFWIVMHSHSFEDAIRRAVSLGADADTLGAIVGSIAEAIWGIPEAMKQQAWHLLPDEMKEVLKAFRHHLYSLTNKQKQMEDTPLHTHKKP
ncbi:ADP-ribosylation/Crystallin J1, partial [gut metagenome]